MGFLEEHAGLAAAAIGAAVAGTGMAAWFYSASLAETFLAAVSAAATAAAAVMIREVSIGVKQLRFEALDRAYRALDSQELKDSVDALCGFDERYWAAFESCLARRNPREAGLVRRPSIELNKAGYLVYRGFLEPEDLAAEFGGFIVRSFACMRPLLLCVRSLSEDPDEPWFMRRFALLAYAVSEAYMLRRGWRRSLAKYLAASRGGGLSPLAAQLHAARMCRRLGGGEALCGSLLPAPRGMRLLSLTQRCLVEDGGPEWLNRVGEALLGLGGGGGCLGELRRLAVRDFPHLVRLGWLERPLARLAASQYPKGQRPPR